MDGAIVMDAATNCNNIGTPCVSPSSGERTEIQTEEGGARRRVA